MSQKVREGKHQHIAHHGLIKLIVMDSLSHLRNHVLWNDFMEIDREIFIETQAITSGETLASNTRGREGKGEEEEEIGKCNNPGENSM